jgi:hypothetical protein
LAAKEFLNPLTGWLDAVNDLDPPKEPPLDPQKPETILPKPWEPWPREPLPLETPLGVSFIWENLNPATLASQIAQNLPRAESLWILTDSEDLKAQFIKAQSLNTLSFKTVDPLRPSLLVLGPALQPDLREFELEGRLDQLARLRAKEIESARQKLDAAKTEAKKINDQLRDWQNLSALEKDLRRISGEAQDRERDWAFASGDLDSAQAAWNENQANKSFWSFLKKKPRKSLDQIQRELAAAESEMARARREKEALLAEAQSTRERLDSAQRIARVLPAQEILTQRLNDINKRIALMTEELAFLSSSFSRAQETQNILAQNPVVLVFPGWAESLSLPKPIDNLIVLNPHGQDPDQRRVLAQLAMWPAKRLIVIGDFTTWSWTGGSFDPQKRPWGSYLAPGEESGRSFVAEETQSGGAEELALSAALAINNGAPKTLPAWPRPTLYPWLAELGFKEPINAFAWPGPWGTVWRAFGENGPFNPISALAAVNLALRARQLAGPKELIPILTPSPAQGQFIRALIQDLAKDAAGLVAGEPAEIADWPTAPLVIMDTALGQEHPWAWRESGRVSILEALSLAKGAICLIGQPDSLNHWPASSPLAKLWSQAAKALPAFRWPPITPLTMWDALDKARNEAIFFLPPFEPGWWKPLSVHFQAALNRQVKITILAQLPSDEQRKYCDAVMRDLKLFGARVALAEGFADLVGLIDQKILTWGWPGRSLSESWNNLWALELPKGAPIVAQVAQTELLAEKLSPQGFRACPQCGWPHVVINQAKAQDFQRRQPLRLGCLNPGCPNQRQPRRLDERWPFLTPPLCPVDQQTPYVRIAKKRGEIWRCPIPDHDCPSLKVIPGDVNPNQRS